MDWVSSPRYTVDLGGHTFPTVKFQRVAERLAGRGALREGSRREPQLPDPADLRLVHTRDWVERVLEGRLTLQEEVLAELPWSKPLMEAHALAVSGTTLAAELALESGLGIHVGGGAHHAFPDHGEGFCLLNDLAVAIERLRVKGRVKRALVVDLDVHQGNGTAAAFKGVEEVFTFSMHQEGGYPKLRARSTVDVELPAGTRDREYQELLSTRLPGILDAHRPELVVYQAGVDVHEGDLLGNLKLTARGVAERDRFVFEACSRRAIPVVLTLGGGYSKDLEETVALHAATVRTALGVFKAG